MHQRELTFSKAPGLAETVSELEISNDQLLLLPLLSHEVELVFKLHHLFQQLLD